MRASTPAFGSFHQTNSAGMKQFVDLDLRYRNTTEEKMASISMKGIASHWN